MPNKSERRFSYARYKKSPAIQMLKLPKQCFLPILVYTHNIFNLLSFHFNEKNSFFVISPNVDKNRGRNWSRS